KPLANQRVTKNMPSAINNPMLESTIEKNKSKNANVSGYINKLTSTKIGEKTNAIAVAHPPKTTPANAIKGPSTITKLKNPRPITAHTARIIFPVVAVVSTFSRWYAANNSFAILSGEPSEVAISFSVFPSSIPKAKCSSKSCIISRRSSEESPFKDLSRLLKNCSLFTADTLLYYFIHFILKCYHFIILLI